MDFFFSFYLLLFFICVVCAGKTNKPKTPKTGKVERQQQQQQKQQTIKWNNGEQAKNIHTIIAHSKMKPEKIACEEWKATKHGFGLYIYVHNNTKQ